MDKNKNILKNLEDAKFSIFEATEVAQKVYGIDSDEEKILQIARKEITNLINVFKNKGGI